MSNAKTPAADPWAMIEADKRRDRFVRRVSVAGWSLTFVVVLAFGAMTAIQVTHSMKLVAVGAAQMTSVLSSIVPFVAVVGVVSLLIATLATIGVFLRLRTASLAEIQLRLAALEEMLVSRGDVAPR